MNEALTKRVNGFYQAHVDGKFRQAEAFVAEENRDDFYSAPKGRIEGFDIMKMAYSADRTKAEVTVATKSIWLIRGEKMTTRVPVTTHWKLENKDWFWFPMPSAGVATPFGMMHFDSGVKADPNARRSPLPADPSVLAQQILSSVKVDKQQVVLSSYEPATAELKVTNGLKGQVKIHVETDGAPADMKVTVDKTDLAADEVATVKLSYKPTDSRPKPTATLRVSVDPLNTVLPVKILFAIPPELEQQLPKDLRPAIKKN